MPLRVSLTFVATLTMADLQYTPNINPKQKRDLLKGTAPELFITVELHQICKTGFEKDFSLAPDSIRPHLTSNSIDGKIPQLKTLCFLLSRTITALAQ